MRRQILIAGGYPHHLPLEIQRAFIAAGWDAHFFDTSPESPFHRPFIKPLRKWIHNFRIQHHPETLDSTVISNLGWRSRRWLKEIERLKPDAALVLRGNRFGAPWMDKAATLVPHVAWMLEPADRLPTFIGECQSGYYQKALVYSKNYVDKMAAAGLKAEFLPHTAAETPPRERVLCEKRDFTWSFLGSHTLWREELLREVLKHFPKGYLQGPRWNKVARRDSLFRPVVHEAYHGKNEAYDLYLSSAIGLDLAPGPEAGDNGITMRVPELLACGCRVIAQSSSELKQAPWETENRLVLFSKAAELIEKMQESLQNSILDDNAWDVAKSVSGYGKLVEQLNGTC